jgi:hypothetical protein
MIYLSIVDTDTGQTLRFASAKKEEDWVWKPWLTETIPMARPDYKKWREDNPFKGRPSTEWSTRRYGAPPTEPTTRVSGVRGVAAAAGVTPAAISARLSKLPRWSPDNPDYLPTTRIKNINVWRTADEDLFNQFQTKVD